MARLRWRPPQPVAPTPELVAAAGSEALAEVLLRRGIASPAAMRAFLDADIDVDASGLPDLDAGVGVLAAAVEQLTPIVVYGDYDTDGVTSTALLVGVLERLGASVSYYIPNRFRDGYGLNARAVQAIAEGGAGLLLTCDCGIKSAEEVALARRLGLQVVVTDHHELGPELPHAQAVINPKRLPEGHPCRMLPGVGTAYLLARRLFAHFGLSPDTADDWLDLVAVGIIADSVPLTGANRLLARRGLSRLWTSPCPGLGALLQVGGVSMGSAEDVAFQVVPRLNSPGRLADAALAVRLLLAADLDTAAPLAQELDALNQERRRLSAAVLNAAVAEVEAAESPAQAVVLYRPEWPEGVLGLVAGQLVERFGVPALLMARKHDGNVVGSGRAPAGFGLLDALTLCSEHLLRFGGHAGAAGFSLREERVPSLRAEFTEQARLGRPAGDTVAPADLTLPLDTVSRQLYDDLNQAAPFGAGNPAPVFYSPGARLLSVRPIGEGGRHLRLVLRGEEQPFSAIWWGAGEQAPGPGPVDIYFRLGLNLWQGKEELQLVVEQLGNAPPTAQWAPALAWQAIDRRGAAPADVAAEFPQAVLVAEGGLEAEGAVDRYGVRPAPVLALLTPPPGPRLLEELVALSGAGQVVFAWSQGANGADRFLPDLLHLLAPVVAGTGWTSLPALAVATGELEPTVHAALHALCDSDLLAIDETAGTRLRLRRRTDGAGVQDSAALTRMRELLAESRAFRRWLRTAAAADIRRAFS